MAQVFIHIPTAWTFAKIKSGADLGTWNAATGQSLVVGDDNPFWPYVLELGVTGNIERAADPAALASYGPIETIAYLDFATIGLALLVGGEVEGLPVWIEVDQANYGDAVPATLPGATYLDDQEVEQSRTWETWHDGHHPRQGPWDGKHYVPGNSMGTELLASVWHPIYASPPAGVRVISQEDFVAIQQTNAEPVA